MTSEWRRRGGVDVGEGKKKDGETCRIIKCVCFFFITKSDSNLAGSIIRASSQSWIEDGSHIQSVGDVLDFLTTSLTLNHLMYDESLRRQHAQLLQWKIISKIENVSRCRSL
jgi:hypothetical protein